MRAGPHRETLGACESSWLPRRRRLLSSPIDGHRRHQSVELLEVHEVVHAGEEKPAPAPEMADQRVVKLAWVGLVPRDTEGGALDESLAAGEGLVQGGKGDILATGQTGHDRASC